MSHIIGPLNHVTVTNQAAQQAVVRPQTSQSRVIMPPHAALAQVVEELVQNPPTDDELRVLTDIGTATDTLVIEKVEAQLEGTRIPELCGYWWPSPPRLSRASVNSEREQRVTQASASEHDQAVEREERTRCGPRCSSPAADVFPGTWSSVPPIPWTTTTG
jgi:hypothetical protein